MKTLIILLVLISGCAAVEERKGNPCADLEPGEIKVINLRPTESGVFGDKNLAWPWVSQHSLIAQRYEATTLVCTKTSKGVCTEAEIKHLCDSHSENPATSSFLNALASPGSFLLDHSALSIAP